MRVLIISNAEWDDGNSFGSTFSNLFSFLPKDNVANIYCRAGSPKTESCGHFLRMGEKDVLRYFLHKGDFPEVFVSTSQEATKIEPSNGGFKRFAKQHRWQLFFMLREMLWSISGWRKSKSLAKFVEEFKPDIIVLPTYSFSYINKLALFLADMYNLPIVSYVSDDEYSYNPYNHSLIYRLFKKYQRIWIKSGIDRSEILYVISEIQKKEYTPIFGDKCKVLTKGGVFVDKPVVQPPHIPIRLVFVGNIGTGRWKTLAMVAEEIEKRNSDGVQFTLDIFTGTNYTAEMKDALTKSGTTAHGFINPKDASKVTIESDILLHVESFNKADEFAVHQSFSTKIVDYLAQGKCIMAVGPSSVASIDFLRTNNAALVASDEKELGGVFDSLISTPEIIESMATKSWEQGKKLCDIHTIHCNLRADLESIIKRE